MNDAEAREHAARTFDENIVVVAGAGTGKTSLLVERVICQMVDQDLKFENFAAITFTEKATAEMRKRLAVELAKLGKLARDRVPPAEASKRDAAGRAYAWLIKRVPTERIAEVAELRRRGLVGAEISTIHSFCAGLLRRYPRESDVDPGFAVDTGLGFDELQRDVWRDFLSGNEGPDGSRTELWRHVLDALDLAELEAIGRSCASFALPEEVVARGLPRADRVLVSVAEHWLRSIERCAPGSPAKGPESWLDAARVPLRALRDSGLEEFSRLLDLARHLRTKGEPENLLDRSPPTSTANRDAEKLAARVQGFFVRVRAIDDAALVGALEIVQPYAVAVRREARARGIVPFDALLSLARKLLRDHRLVRRELGERYTVLFLDEFQDTDPLQYEIVLFLAEDPKSPAVDDAFETRLAPGKLFIVGDPKQAIYRFRGADIAAYRKAEKHVVEDNAGTRLALVTNFRAKPEILQPLNALLKPLLTSPDPESESAYSEYDPLVSDYAPAGEARVEIWTVLDLHDAKLSAYSARRAEAEAIASWVATEVEAGRLRPRQIALLFRALKDIHVYARALQDRGVPCLVGRSEHPESQPAGQQLLALLRALANPADAPAVLGVLRSSLGAVADSELARWAGRFNGREREACWSYPDTEPPEAELPNLARIFSLLRLLRMRARSDAPDALLAALVEQTPLLAIHASARDGERRAADLWLLVERLVEVAQAAPGRDLADLVRELEAEDRRPVLDDTEDAPDCVRLSSIHGAKGLEFPVVILPDLARGKGGGGSEDAVSVKLLRESGAISISTRAGVSATWIARELDEERHGKAEAARVFYVACTRAEERLIFVHSPRKQKPTADAQVHYLDPWDYPLEGFSEDRRLEVEGGVVLARAVPVPDRSEPTRLAASAEPPRNAIARAARAVALARESAKPPFASPSGLREDAEAHALASDPEEIGSAPVARDAPDNRIARALGTVLHDALERWDFRDASALFALVGAAAQRIAAEESLSGEDLARDARALAGTLLASDLPAHLASVDVIGRELPVLFRDPDDTAWSGTIDLLYRDTDGRLVVADYKTDRAPDDAARAHYRAQLSTYARGVARVFPGEPEPALELVWLRSGLRERLRLESDA